MAVLHDKTVDIQRVRRSGRIGENDQLNPLEHSPPDRHLLQPLDVVIGGADQRVQYRALAASDSRSTIRRCVSGQKIKPSSRSDRRAVAESAPAGHDKCRAKTGPLGHPRAGIASCVGQTDAPAISGALGRRRKGRPAAVYRPTEDFPPNLAAAREAIDRSARRNPFSVVRSGQVGHVDRGLGATAIWSGHS